MLFVGLIIAVVIADQAVKFLVISRFAFLEALPVVPGLFDLKYIRNTGGAFGIFSGYNSVLVTVSLLVLVLLAVFRRRIMPDNPVHKLAACLIAGGIIGNVIDRIKYGYVIDYLDFYCRGHHFPAFNIADSAICVGTFLFIIWQWRLEHRNAATAATDDKALSGLHD